MNAPVTNGGEIAIAVPQELESRLPDRTELINDGTVFVCPLRWGIKSNIGFSGRRKLLGSAFGFGTNPDFSPRVSPG
jgi:hypothetical protein